jgi:hypothetical protein
LTTVTVPPFSSVSGIVPPVGRDLARLGKTAGPTTTDFSAWS